MTLKRVATIEYTRVKSPRPIDEFDLDVRLGRGREPVRPAIGFTEDICDIETQLGQCGGNTDFTCPGDCVPDTQRTFCGRPGSTCLEVCDATPFFCNTQGRATCGTCQGNTCQTCNTCAATCRTCETWAGDATCRTCETCGPRMCP